MKLNALSTIVALAFTANSAFATPPEKTVEEPIPFFNKTESGYDLEFKDQNYRLIETEVNGEKIQFRAFERIVYVQNPVDPDYQTINVYVPEAYYNNGEINGYKAETAPIFFPNSVGGYMPAKAASYDKKRRDGSPNAILVALSKGYVVASVGARGRTLQKEGKYIGKAPAVIVDLKSAVRYLHANDENMPGDANKIISNGTSAGGAISALLGASADHFDYEPYFKEIGALKASDKIFAVSAYCPITNLEKADIAYEWEFNGLNEYSRIDMNRLNAQSYNDRSSPMPKIEGVLSETEIKLSNKLAAKFPTYLNSLNLIDENGEKLTLDPQGNGSFKDYLVNVVKRGANQAYSQLPAESEEKKSFQEINWLSFENDKITDLDWFGYIFSAKRMKSPTAFDALSANSGENSLFGSETENNRHFTLFSMENSTNKAIQLASPQIVKQMNAMHYLDNPNAAEHWRIRVGSADRDTSHAISAILAVKLQMTGKNVNYEIPWGIPHAGDYDLDELFQWADEIVKGKK
ncbi:alpha/beta hydrolase [Mannheimia sp. AT1]|uniref:Alpha/beta hydrolase n=1 Tax=Mannheimia cairinae TaxID=3025936 RepID=A0ABT5MNS2_9PAST|nr:subtype B tannase [Mannheimia cairinae]MDD0823119.1 alpha/beta hydrolase [Mannheimia cairinae]MDD0825856.1 alpha/beta hydrolase [Mannheimia cairinae]